MLTNEHFKELEVNGYTVVSDVLTSEECDGAINQYRQWLAQFKDGEWPYTKHSLIQRYNTGNMTPTWFVRLKSKKVFAQLFRTDKLLSSVDAIAIGRPPEDGEEEFYVNGKHWLHLDQNPARDGLHAYQGSVYLETADEDDWTLQVLEGSHKHFKEFYKSSPRALMRGEMNKYYHLLPEDVEKFEEKGCQLKRVPVPKGGIVLWDSRLVHANAGPLKGRKHPGRWRFCVFVSMTPAIWASREDLRKKREAYENARMTTHWSSQGISFFDTGLPSYTVQDVEYPKELPEIAKTREAQLLCGVVSYNYKDGNPTGAEFLPKWDNSLFQKDSHEFDKHKLLIGCVGMAVIAAGVGYILYKYKYQ